MLGARPDARGEGEPAGEIVLHKGAGWYDYEAKYTEGGMELVVPARISERARERVRALAVEAFELAGCSGLARVDFFVDGDTVLLNELNTCRADGHERLREAVGRGGHRVPDVLERLCRIALDRHAAERNHVY